MSLGIFHKKNESPFNFVHFCHITLHVLSSHYTLYYITDNGSLRSSFVDGMTGKWRGIVIYFLVRAVRGDTHTTTISINYLVDIWLYDLFKFSMKYTAIVLVIGYPWPIYAFRLKYHFVLATRTNTIRLSVSLPCLFSQIIQCGKWTGLVGQPHVAKDRHRQVRR